MRESLKRQIFEVGTWLLGVVFGMAAILKVLDFPSFSAQLARYDVISEPLVAPAAVGILILEATLGACSLLALQARRAVWGMLLLVTLFASATLLRWDLLAGTDCNCFGQLFGGGPSSVVLLDALLAGTAILVLAAGRNLGAGRLRRLRLRAGTGILVIASVTLAAQPAPAGDLLGDDSQSGDEIRVFLAATCKHCRESLGQVRELAEAPGLPPLRIFIGADNDQQIGEFLKDAGPLPEHTPLTLRQLGGFIPRVPTVQIVRDGKIQREWSAEVPRVADAHQALGELAKADSGRRRLEDMQANRLQ